MEINRCCTNKAGINILRRPFHFVARQSSLDCVWYASRSVFKSYKVYQLQLLSLKMMLKMTTIQFLILRRLIPSQLQSRLLLFSHGVHFHALGKTNQILLSQSNALIRILKFWYRAWNFSITSSRRSTQNVIDNEIESFKVCQVTSHVLRNRMF